MLGDSFSRNPKDRDALLAARKDLEGLTGQLRGFDLDQYLGEGTEGEGPVPWAVGTGDRGSSRGCGADSGSGFCGFGLREVEGARLRVDGNSRGVSTRASGAQCRGSRGMGTLPSHFDTGTKKIKRLRVDLHAPRCFGRR